MVNEMEFKFDGEIGTIEKYGGNLEIDAIIWKSLFDHVIDPTIEHIKRLLQEEVMKGCNYLCLVGGLSCSPYFQHRMKKAFGEGSDNGLTVIIPEKPILTVIQGAAYFAKRVDYIRK